MPMFVLHYLNQRKKNLPFREKAFVVRTKSQLPDEGISLETSNSAYIVSGGERSYVYVFATDTGNVKVKAFFGESLLRA